jgi:L-lactate dehydrogenase
MPVPGFLTFYVKTRSVMKPKVEQSIRRVIVVGAGRVGATYSYALAQSGLADEIVLIDKNEDLARGEVLDLVHGQPFFPNVAIRTGTPADYAAARLVVITAGIAQKPDETRLQLLASFWSLPTPSMY